MSNSNYSDCEAQSFVGKRIVRHAELKRNIIGNGGKKKASLKMFRKGFDPRLTTGRAIASVLNRFPKDDAAGARLSLVLLFRNSLVLIPLSTKSNPVS